MLTLVVSFLLAATSMSTSPDYQQILEQFRNHQDIPGISAVVTRRHAVAFAGASGLADIEANREMTADTILYAGSLSKVMTAVLVLQLVADGRLALSQTALEVAHPEAASISISQLLAHRSGLVREGDFGYWFSGEFPDRAALLRFLRDTELQNLPGIRTSYSNIGYAALGYVVENATGVAFAEALKNRVFAPLGMTSSGGRGPAPGVSRGYTPSGRLLPDDERPFAGVGKRLGNRHLREYHDARAMAPAFGAYSTAADLGRLARFLLGYGPDGVLQDDLRQLMFTPRGSGRGLGIRIARLDGRSVARHDGWFAAHRSHLLLDFETGIGVVVMANSDNADPALLAEALLALAAGDIAD
ncbi:MAG: serine hydrolase domain-containing protein [Woeseiaceae bacterium]|nr:serine hydrolase domain-containing protein [Woeseiaceae bacterium]